MNKPVNLDNLRDMIDNDVHLEQELITIFMISSDNCFNRLQENTTDKTDGIWRDQAHAWKGLCLNLGAVPLSALCAEAQNHEGLDASDKLELLGKIEEEYRRLKEHLTTP